MSFEMKTSHFVQPQVTSYMITTPTKSDASDLKKTVLLMKKFESPYANIVQNPDATDNFFLVETQEPPFSKNTELFFKKLLKQSNIDKFVKNDIWQKLINKSQKVNSDKEGRTLIIEA